MNTCSYKFVNMYKILIIIIYITVKMSIYYLVIYIEKVFRLLYNNVCDLYKKAVTQQALIN